jgi:hypothetical protein
MSLFPDDIIQQWWDSLMILSLFPDKFDDIIQ